MSQPRLSQLNGDDTVGLREVEEDARSWGHESGSQEGDEDGDAVSIDNVELREVPVAPRRLNLNHGFMRYIVRNQHDRKTFEQSQTEQSHQRHSEAKEDQLKSDGVKVKRKQRNREKPPAQAPDPPRERVEVKKRTGFTPYRPPHMRTS